MNTDARRVYLIDDDEAVRFALRLLLETLGMQVTPFADPLVFLAQLAKLEPGCLVLDIRMPTLSGLRLQERLTAAGCDWPVILISGHGDIDACRRAFKNGAVDFLSKPVDEQDLIDAVQKGHAQLDQARAAAAELAEATALLARLTDREREVLDLIVRGLTSREIATVLAVSPRTVDSHRTNLTAKLGTRSVAELARLVIDGAQP